jgi:membrane-anchored protein YejM (alkaline phosphatase superfamily)
MKMQKEHKTCLRIAMLSSLASNSLAVLILVFSGHLWKVFQIVPALLLGAVFLPLMVIWPWPANGTALLIASEVLALSFNILLFYTFMRMIRVFIRDYPGLSHSPSCQTDKAI